MAPQHRAKPGQRLSDAHFLAGVGLIRIAVVKRGAPRVQCGRINAGDRCSPRHRYRRVRFRARIVGVARGHVLAGRCASRADQRGSHDMLRVIGGERISASEQEGASVSGLLPKRIQLVSATWPNGSMIRAWSMYVAQIIPRPRAKSSAHAPSVREHGDHIGQLVVVAHFNAPKDRETIHARGLLGLGHDPSKPIQSSPRNSRTGLAARRRPYQLADPAIGILGSSAVNRL